MIAYHGEKTPDTTEEGAKVMPALSAWYEDLCDAVAYPANSVGMLKTVSSESVADNSGANPLSGFTIIRADDIDPACAAAAIKPKVVDGSGTAEAAPLIEM